MQGLFSDAAQPRTNRIDRFLLSAYALYIILLIAACSEFAFSLSAQVIYILFSLFLLLRKGTLWLRDSMGAKIAVVCALVTVAHYLLLGKFVIGSAKFCVMVLSVYYVLKQYRLLYFDTLVNTIHFMALLTLPFFAVQLIDANLLAKLMSPFNFSFQTQAEKGGVYIFLFNLNPMAPMRNSGFMWEPGAFGAVLLLSLLYYAVKRGFRLDKRFFFIFFYALTTTSTATFIGLLFLVVLIVLERNKLQPHKIIIYAAVLALIGVQIYNLPFMGEKLDHYFSNNLDYKSLYRQSDFEGGVSIGRFAGLMIELDKLKQSPLIGSGWDNDYSDLGIGNEWSNPNGLAVLLGKFGISGVLFILYGLLNFLYTRSQKSFLLRLICALIILVPLFSNPFEINILFWSFVMTGVINRAEIRRHAIYVKRVAVTTPRKRRLAAENRQS